MVAPLNELSNYILADDGPSAADDPEPVRTPEWWLCHAILKDVVETLQGSAGSWRRRDQSIRNALRWIRDPREDAEWHLTFKMVCAVLGVEPGKIRKALDATGRERLAG